MSLFNTFHCNFHTAYGVEEKQLVSSWEIKEQCGDRENALGWSRKTEYTRDIGRPHIFLVTSSTLVNNLSMLINMRMFQHDVLQKALELINNLSMLISKMIVTLS